MNGTRICGVSNPIAKPSRPMMRGSERVHAGKRSVWPESTDQDQCVGDPGPCYACVTETECSLAPVHGANHERALDFVHDGVAAGRMICVLSVVNALTRVPKGRGEDAGHLIMAKCPLWDESRAYFPLGDLFQRLHPALSPLKTGEISWMWLLNSLGLFAGCRNPNSRSRRFLETYL